MVDEQQAQLGVLGDSRDDLPVAHDVDIHRRRGSVVVTLGIVHLLLVPLHLAGERIEGDNAVAVEVVAGMVSRTGDGFNRNEDQASIGIKRGRAPDVR